MNYNHIAHWLLVSLCSAGVCQCTALEPEQIWELVSPSCVRIEATQLDGTKTLGTGFAFEIDGKKYILSNRHVVLGASRVQIGHSASNLLQAPSYRICPSLDFAVIDVPQKFTIAAAKKRLSPLKTGERAYAIGFPLGLNKSITLGLINSHGEEYVQFDASISSGNSGGPLVDKDGAVIGVVTAGARAVNVAINIASVPKARVFVDPIVSFYDAWRQFVQFESRLGSDLERLKVLEVQQYLMVEFAAALEDRASLRDERAREVEAWREKALRTIKQSHKDIGSAIVATMSLLRGKVSEFDALPKLFAGLGRQQLLEQFIRDKRPGGLFRLNIDMGDIVPLLTVSLEHIKAKYEDTAYQLDFLGRNRSRIVSHDPTFLTELKSIDEKAKSLKRNTIRLKYPASAKGTTGEPELQNFILSMLPLAQNAELIKMRLDKRITAEQKFTQFGGFEGEILGMFQRLAIEQIQQNHLDQALGFIRNETAHRKFPAWRIEAHILVCRGDFETAYKTYEKALYTSETQIDPFQLKRKSSTTTDNLDEISTEQDGFWSYPKPIQANWKEWNQFIFTKGGLSTADAASPQEAFATQAFARLSVFEKARIIHRIQSRSLGDKFYGAAGDSAIACRLGRVSGACPSAGSLAIRR